MRSLIAGMAFGTILLAVGCGDEKPSVSASTNAASRTPPVVAKPAPSTEVADTGLIVTGPIIVEHQVEIMAQRDGVLEKVFFDAPSRVRAGTVLAQMDDRQISANLEAARAKSRSIANDLKNWEAEAEVLKADYTRAQKMWDLGLISEEGPGACEI